jgi:hypothetical protein
MSKNQFNTFNNKEINSNNKIVKVKFPDVKSEGILQINEKENKKTKRKPRGFYLNKTDEELIKYGKDFCKKNQIKSRSELYKKNGGLYDVMKKHKFLDSIFAPLKCNPRGFYLNKTDEELIKYGKDFCKKYKIKSRSEIDRKNVSLYNALRERKLLDSIFDPLKRKLNGFYSNMGDKELIEYTQNFCKDNNITKRSELQIKNKGLHNVISERKRLDSIFGPLECKPRGFYSKMSDKELIKYSKDFCDKNKITKRSELEKKNATLYNVLLKRKIFDSVLDRVKTKYRGFYLNKTDEELIKYGKDFCKKNQIKSRSELDRKNRGLYRALWKNKLLDSVFPGQSHLGDLVDAIRNFGAGFDDE